MRDISRQQIHEEEAKKSTSIYYLPAGFINQLDLLCKSLYPELSWNTHFLKGQGHEIRIG